jgi:glycerol-3-phosphate acyltransferase PlsX
MSSVTIALDAMGGDRAPEELVAGAVEAAREGVGVLLCGRVDEIERELRQYGTVAGVEIVDAPDLIDFHDEPAAAVRSKPGSSMVTACRTVREGRAQGAISAGSTGGMLAASLLTMGRIKGVHRPGIAVPLPARGGPCVLIDAGANSESKPENLRQFGVMGAIFAEEVLGVDNPNVGLLSVGEEATKGTSEVVEAHALLAASGVNFGGNCEGRDALSGEFQVVVADGFAGNVLLKGLEGAGAMLLRELRDAARSSLRAKIGGLLLMPALRSLRDRIDPETYGGAYLLGVRGISVIAHGNSSQVAIRNAVRVAARGVEHDIVGRMAQRLGAATAGSDLQEGDRVNTVPLVPESENGEHAHES